MWCRFGDPGFEHREDMESGLSAAASGGFTGVALLPNNRPVTDSKNAIRYLHSRAKGSPVEVYPIAAVTKGAEGEDLSEMIDLHTSGAVAFSDGVNSIRSTDIVLKSLQYLQKFDGVLIQRPVDHDLAMFGTVHEGKVSTSLGLKGIPSVAEEIVIERDLRLLEYGGGKMHFGLISSKGSVKLIRNAKKKFEVTASVAAQQLMFNDKSLMDFDTNYKVDPPFRSESDLKALKKALDEGVIDVVCSGHDPQDIEGKRLEFDLAEFGAIGLQTVFPTLIALSKEIKLDKLLDAISTNPRKILGLEVPEISEGSEANLTLFDPDMMWKFDQNSNRSKGVNSPYFGIPLQGKAVGIFNRNQFWLDTTVD
jgi:dihydroorotase